MHPGAETTTTASRPEGMSSSSVAGPTVDSGKASDDEPMEDYAQQLALDAADYWRPLFGLPWPAPPEDDNGGICPQHEEALGRRLQQMSANERLKALSLLNIIVST